MREPKMGGMHMKGPGKMKAVKAPKAAGMAKLGGKSMFDNPSSAKKLAGAPSFKGPKI